MMVKSVKYTKFSDQSDDQALPPINNTNGAKSDSIVQRHHQKDESALHRNPTALTSPNDKDDDDDLSWYIDNHESSLSSSGQSKSLLVDAFRQLKIIFSLGAPNCIEKFSSFFPGFMLLIFYGELGPDEISAVGFGFMFGNVTGISIVIGFALGLGPLVSQAFGAQNYVRCGELLQRTILIHLILVVPPVSVLWLNTEPLLLALGQPPEIVKLTAEFLYWRLPAIPFLCLAEDIGNFVKAQRIMMPSMALMIVVNIASVVLSALLVLPKFRHTSLGFKGGPIALSIANVLQCIGICFFGPRWIQEKDAWPKWSFNTAIRGWGEILAMSLPAALSMWGEWWAWELSFFLTGFLCDNEDDDDVDDDGHSNDEINADGECIEIEVYSIIANTMILVYFLSAGYSWGAATHVGNLLGAGDYKSAKLTSKVLIIFVICISGSIAITLLILRHQWGALFSNNPHVDKMISKLLYFVSGYIVLDSLTTGALNSLLRAAGHVKWPAVVTVFSFYGVGLPLGAFLTFGPPNQHSIFSLWQGLFVGMSSMLIGLSICFYLVDFKEASKIARERALVKDVVNVIDDDDIEDVLKGLEVAIEMADAYESPNKKVIKTEPIDEEEDEDNTLVDNSTTSVISLTAMMKPKHSYSKIEKEDNQGLKTAIL